MRSKWALIEGSKVNSRRPSVVEKMRSANFFLLLATVFTLQSFGNGHDEAARKYRNFVKPCFDSDYGKETETETCAAGEGKTCKQTKTDEEELRLVRLDGVKTGHIQQVDVGDPGRNVTLITRSLKPLLFEIPDFLSDDDCDHLVSLSKQTKFETSIDGFDKTIYEGSLDEALDNASDSPPSQNFENFGNFKFWDQDKDNFITLREIERICAEFAYLYYKEEQIKAMFNKIGFHGYRNDRITGEDFATLNIPKLMSYLHYKRNKDPRHRPRYSETTWLERHHRLHDPVIRRLEERVTKLTKLPRTIIRQSESLQVVHYGPHGHYHAHYDSGASAKDPRPCCHHEGDKPNGCQICRFMTVLYYLNDVIKGGETAFPVADNATFDIQVLWKARAKENSATLLNLSENCYGANLVIKPKKGQALMWYNHFVDDATGLLGNVDWYSAHGGCDVIRGEKYIANHWILAPLPGREHLESIYDLDYARNKK